MCARPLRMKAVSNLRTTKVTLFRRVHGGRAESVRSEMDTGYTNAHETSGTTNLEQETRNEYKITRHVNSINDRSIMNCLSAGHLNGEGDNHLRSWNEISTAYEKSQYRLHNQMAQDLSHRIGFGLISLTCICIRSSRTASRRCVVVVRAAKKEKSIYSDTVSEDQAISCSRGSDYCMNSALNK